MKLKKIDLDNKYYLRGRKIVGTVAEFGFVYGASTIVGTLYKACGGKKIGLLPFAIGASAINTTIGENVAEMTENWIQTAAILWNDIVDVVDESSQLADEVKASEAQKDESEDDIPEEQTQIPESQLWPEPVGRDDENELNDWIAKWQIFEFNDRTTAEETFGFLKKHDNFFYSMHGDKRYLTLRDYIQTRIACDERFAFIMTDGVLDKMQDYLDIYGWSAERLENAYIDPIIGDDGEEHKYILVMMDYSDLSYIYDIQK